MKMGSGMAADGHTWVWPPDIRLVEGFGVGDIAKVPDQVVLKQL